MVARGRRPAGQDTRVMILDAARAEFSEQGYDGTSLRAIARRAKVDAALLHHYFAGKPGIFAESIAIPIDPEVIVGRIVEGPIDELGERLVRAFFAVWDDSDRRESFVALMRAAVSNEAAARSVREFISAEIFGRIALHNDIPNPQLRANLAASQMIGLALGRYVIALEPLTTTPVEELVRLVAPAIAGYLTPN